eukprot:scaffold95_cov476-Prasinococcus_capsulatus_cf.AAC.5
MRPPPGGNRPGSGYPGNGFVGSASAAQHPPCPARGAAPTSGDATRRGTPARREATARRQATARREAAPGTHAASARRGGLELGRSGDQPRREAAGDGRPTARVGRRT